MSRSRRKFVCSPVVSLESRRVPSGGVGHAPPPPTTDTMTTGDNDPPIPISPSLIFQAPDGTIRMPDGRTIPNPMDPILLDWTEPGPPPPPDLSTIVGGITTAIVDKVSGTFYTFVTGEPMPKPPIETYDPLAGGGGDWGPTPPTPFVPGVPWSITPEDLVPPE